MRIRTTRRQLIDTVIEIDSDFSFADIVEVKTPPAGPHWYLDAIVEYDDFLSPAFPGPVVFHIEDEYASPVHYGASYGQMYLAFIVGQRARRDEHHIYYEGWSVTHVDDEGITHVDLHSGS